MFNFPFNIWLGTLTTSVSLGLLIIMFKFIFKCYFECILSTSNWQILPIQSKGIDNKQNVLGGGSWIYARDAAVDTLVIQFAGLFSGTIPEAQIMNSSLHP